MSGKKRMETTFTWNCWTNKKAPPEYTKQAPKVKTNYTIP